MCFGSFFRKPGWDAWDEPGIEVNRYEALGVEVTGDFTG